MAADDTLNAVEILDAPQKPKKATPLTLVPAKRLRLPLKKACHAADEIARCYREVKAGKLESQEGSRRAYILSQLGKVIETAVLKAQIDELREQIEGRG